MKLVLIASALCLASVFATPSPDEAIRLEAVAEPPKVKEEPTSTVTPPSVTKQSTVEDRTRLVNQLLTGYNKNVNPDNVKLKFGISLIDFKVYEKRNVLESYIWQRFVWQDTRLKWSPEEFGGETVIRLDANEIWKPDVTLYNSADPVNMVNCWNSKVLIFSNGEVLWVSPCKVTSMCELSLNKYPYGEQTCTYKFGSWTFDGNVLDLQLYKAEAKIDTSDIKNTSGFEVLSTTAEKHEKYYSCCTEPYPDITFNMTIKRIPGDELFNKM